MIEDIFAKIIVRELPASIVYEDDETLAFLDITPVNPGHTLVVAKTAGTNILDVDEKTFLAVMRTVYRLSPAVKAASGASGINIHINNEASAGQIVPRLHVHIIPRYE